jgi:hypothetical protein
MEIGATYLTKGLDMNCRAVTVRVELVEMLETPIVHPGRNGRPDVVFDCVTRSQGVEVYGKSNYLRPVSA